MGDITYSVATTGVITNGASRSDVVLAFANLFKIEPGKAKGLVGVKRVLKKNIDEKKAQAYKQKLESIGLEVRLHRHGAPAQTPKKRVPNLSLVPLEEETHQEPTNAPSPSAQSISQNISQVSPGLSLALIEEQFVQTHRDVSEGATDPQSLSPKSPFPVSENPNLIICPKCKMEQPVETEECTGCGIFIRKLQAKLEKDAEAENATVAPSQRLKAQALPSSNRSRIIEEETSHEELAGDKFTPLSLVAASVAAFLGAMLWKLVAVWFGIEHGIVAWAVGGAIGFAAAIAGGQGQISGGACAALAFCAIIGGKLMTVQSYSEDPALLLESITGISGVSMDDYLPEMYEQDMSLAKSYDENVYDDASLKQFLVDAYYSEAEVASQVQQEEIDYFKQVDEPRLKILVANEPTYEDWKESYLKYYFDNSMVLNENTGEYEEQSDLDYVLSNLDFVDLVFLFLGLFTAFKLGSGYRLER